MVKGATTSQGNSASAWKCVLAGKSLTAIPLTVTIWQHLAPFTAHHPHSLLTCLQAPARYHRQQSKLCAAALSGRRKSLGPSYASCPSRDDAHAIELANDSRFGLGASIWTADHARFHRMVPRIKAGIVWLNTHHRNDPSSPWAPLRRRATFRGAARRVSVQTRQGSAGRTALKH